MFESAGGFHAYFACMYYYGFTHSGLIGLNLKPNVVKPDSKMHYNPTRFDFGNENLVN